MGKYDSSPTVAGALVRLARYKAGLTQMELAARAGVGQQMISAYETGRREPTFPTLTRLLEAAGFELTIRLIPLDDQNQDLAAYTATLAPEIVAEIESAARRRVEAARLKRVRGH
jgi:transcriptional regulator with XRE-family HTH domain